MDCRRPDLGLFVSAGAPLAEAAAAVGVPLEAVEALARSYQQRLALEVASRVTLKAARRHLRDVRAAAAAARQASRLPPLIAALGSADGWSAVAGRLVADAAALVELAESMEAVIERRAAEAGFRRGGKSTLARLLIPEPKAWLASEAAALIAATGRAPTSTPGGPLFRLVAAIHDRATGEGEKGVASAIRKVLVAATERQEPGSRDDLEVQPCSDVVTNSAARFPCEPIHLSSSTA